MKIRKKCLSCKKGNLKEIINLGLHSFADRFVEKKNLNKKDPIYPLIIDYCIRCKFIQSRIITAPKDRYSSIDYSYTSSNSKYSKNHWINYANLYTKNLILKIKKF